MAETRKGPEVGSLGRKLAEVMAAINAIPKKGHNDFHGYDYATEADIVAAVRAELAKRQVALIPSTTDEHREAIGQTKAGRTVFLTRLGIDFMFVDGESGETLSRHWMGWGSDESDKGGYKAMTGAEKYFLLKTFLIPTGDDPESSEAVTDPAAAPSTGDVCVTRVERKATKKAGTTQYRVHFSDGTRYSTIVDALGALAEELKQTGEAVTYETKQNGQWENLTAIHRTSAEPDAGEPPVPQDDDLVQPVF